MYRSLRKLKINREFMVFIVFLLVSIVFWFVQTFKESTTAKINYKLEITDTLLFARHFSTQGL